MKRLIIIGIAFVFLLSGMHISIATHYCGGKAAGMKLSLSGNKASCGMEADASAIPSAETLINTRCCYDDLTVYKTESHYAPAEFGHKMLTQSIVQQSIIPAGIFRESLLQSQYRPADIGPPGQFTASSVNSAEICIFRI
jgi:hypothetical protein